MEQNRRDQRILHALSQIPGKTGSGVTLDAIVRGAARAGLAQRAIVATPATDPAPPVADLPDRHVLPLLFEQPPLPYPVPGMSDVMPYPSTVFSTMDAGRIAGYVEAFENHIARAVDSFRPSVIHSHHVWLMSSIIKDVAPSVPVITHCHATGLRQMELCPHLASRVLDGCRRNDLFAVLSEQHGNRLVETLDLEPHRIHVVGAGYREDVFHIRGRAPSTPRRILYVGKYSESKGLPSLLDAFETLNLTHAPIELHVAGTGSGDEAARIESRMRSARGVILHGMLDQPSLADLMRTCEVCVLPSFYEGVPLVLIEALACGCRLVTTRLPGVTDRIAPHARRFLHVVDLPDMLAIDVPDPAGLPAFVDSVIEATASALEAPSPAASPTVLEVAVAPFGWRAVFGRVARMYDTVARDEEKARASRTS